MTHDGFSRWTVADVVKCWVSKPNMIESVTTPLAFAVAFSTIR